MQAKLQRSLQKPYAEKWFLRTQQNKGQHLLTRYTTEANFGQFKGLKEHLRKNINTSQQSARKVNSTLCLIYRYWLVKKTVKQHYNEAIIPVAAVPKREFLYKYIQ